MGLSGGGRGRGAFEARREYGFGVGRAIGNAGEGSVVEEGLEFGATVLREVAYIAIDFRDFVPGIRALVLNCWGSGWADCLGLGFVVVGCCC